MAIADIQITPPVLNLDPATRQGRFRVQVANQLGREGRLQASVIPVGETQPDWLRVDEKFRQLVLKKDETAVFDVAVAVPSDVTPGTYGFKLRCADELDPANVKVDSEQRDFVVAAAVVKPGPPAWRKWLLIAVGGVVLIAGVIWLGWAITSCDEKCEPACLVGQVCHDGKCKAEAAGARDGGPARDPRPDACVEGAGTTPCGQCEGKLQCDGSCSKPNPPKLGQACGRCGGKINCQGLCSVADPPKLGERCNQCAGVINCQGACAPAMPADFGRVSVKYRDRRPVGFGKTFGIGGRCDPGHTIADVTPVTTTTNIGLGGLKVKCEVTSVGAGSDCTATISAPASPLPVQVECETIITQRRGCD